jgi:hypothetical protein
MNYYYKYIKYKQKYLKLKNQDGGKIPFITLDNKTIDYFPFDNNDFNYYHNDYLLINNKKEINYSLNDKFELDKFNISNNNYNEKNIINNNNIYKLADQIINISSNEIFPFHLCLLSKYKILDNLYKKHINTIDNPNILWSESANKDKEYRIFELDDNNKKIYLSKHAKKVYKEIFTLYDDIYEIVNINYNYNILLKYSYCNKFLELLQLIYKIQLEKISYDSLNITTINKKNDQDIKIFDKYNLEDYIIVNIINIFISPISKLKNNFDIIYVFYKEEQFKIKKEEFKIEKEQLEKEIEQLEKEIEQFKIEIEQLEIEKKQLEIEIEQLEIEKKQFKINKKIEKKKLKIIENELIIKTEIEKLKLNLKEIKQLVIEEEEKLKLKEDYNDAKQTYINISDTTLLFQYISKSHIEEENQKKEKKENFKNNVLQKITTNLEDDIKQISYYLEDDIKQIKKLLLFNLYVDNIKDISPKFSYIFYASFIYYRINKPLISYTTLSNLYPINENNFVCNLIGINSDRLIKIMNEDNDESINKLMFNTKYIKHPIHSYEGFLIRIQNGYNRISYQNCTENGILEFIKILFWDQGQFVLKLPEENTKTETEPLKLLNEIFIDINTYLKNQTNIKSLYNSQEYHEKMHKLFIHKNKNIIYKRNNYELDASVENFYNMLCIILNFDSKEKLESYFNNINEYNSNITEIKKVPDIYSTNINIYIQNEILYTINITDMHVKVNSIDNADILKLIEYDYFNLLIYNTDILSKYSMETCYKYIDKYINNLSTLKKNDKNYEYLVELIIIKYPKLSQYFINYNEKYDIIICSAIKKNPEIICYLQEYNKSSLEIFLNIIIDDLDKIKEHQEYISIIYYIFEICIKNKFNNIILNVFEKNPEILCIKLHITNPAKEDLINDIINNINLFKTNEYYKDIVKCILITLLEINNLNIIENIIKKNTDYFFNNCLEILMTIKNKQEISSIMKYLYLNHEEIILEQIKNKPKIICYLNLNYNYMIPLLNKILNDLENDHTNYKDIVKYIFINSGYYKKLNEIIKIKEMFKNDHFNNLFYDIIIDANKDYRYAIIKNLFIMKSFYKGRIYLNIEKKEEEKSIHTNLDFLLNKLKNIFNNSKDHYDIIELYKKDEEQEILITKEQEIRRRITS